MKPYYDHDGITIYHGDCREILPTLGPVDLVLTDPPYVGLVGGHHYSAGGIAAPIKDSVSVGDEWGASDEWLSVIPETKAIISFTT